MNGKIHSIQTMGTLDGPGVRVVVFMQGCALRCWYCHNPDTWNMDGGREIDSLTLFNTIKKYKSYFRNSGGVTLSGGEPLLQNKFVTEVLRLCKHEGIHTAIDTSGYPLTSDALEVLKLCDLVLLDIKMTTESDYTKYIGCKLESVLDFLKQTEQLKKEVWIRQVIVPKINDTVENIENLNAIVRKFDCIKKVELLPFQKLCIEKYEQLKIPFKLKDTPQMSKEKIKELEMYINKI